MSQFDLDVMAGLTRHSAPYGVQSYALAAAAIITHSVVEVTHDALGSDVYGDAVWLCMMSNVDVYVIVGLSDVPDPAPLATAALTPTQQCVWVPAGTPWHRKYDKNRTTVKVLNNGAVAGTVRFERTSVIAGGDNTGM